MVREYYINKNTILKKEHLVLLGVAVLIFLIHIRNIANIGIFTVLDDEFGYWGNAAYLAGLDWSDAVSEIPYYSYGYSLLLVPLFWIFDNPVYMYKAAIVLNGILLSISFLLCYDIAKKLIKGTNSYIFMGIAFLISMYPSYIVYSSIAWCECLLILSCWLLTWCFVGLSEESSSYKFILIGFLSIYAYVIHQRTLGILIASIFVISIMKIFNKIHLKQFLMVVIPIIILLIIHIYLKDDIQSHLWLNSFGNLTNDYSAQLGKICQVITIDGLARLFKIFLGQFFYIGAASYLMGYFGLYELIRKVGKAIITAVKNRKPDILNREYNFYPYLFLLIATLSSHAISVIFMINPTRFDHIVYGRYIDMIIGIVILLGFIKLMDKDVNLNKILGVILTGFILLTAAVNYIIKSSGLTTFHSLQATGLLFINTPLSVYLPALVAIFACRLIFLPFANNKKMKIKASIIVITICFFLTGNTIAQSTVKYNQSTMEIVNTVEFINNTDGKLPIYYLWDDQGNPDYGKWDNRNTANRLIADCYQFLLKDENITLVNNSELSTIPGNKFVIASESIVRSGLLKDYKFCMSAAGSYLYVSK